MNRNSALLGLAYIASILVFSMIYLFVPDILNQKVESFSVALYFSVVTITTLGFGEIHPNSDLGMYIVVCQVIVGITILGLFLSSFWQGIVDKIEKNQNEKMKKLHIEEKRNELITYIEYYEIFIKNVQTEIVEMTTPYDKIKNQIIPKEVIDFQDLVNIYNQSMLVKNGMFKLVVHAYFEKLNEFVFESKQLMVNTDLSHFNSLKVKLISLLHFLASNDIEDAFDIYKRNGDESVEKLKKLIIQMIQQRDGAPKLEELSGNMLLPVAGLYYLIQRVNQDLIEIKLIIDGIRAESIADLTG